MSVGAPRNSLGGGGFAPLMKRRPIEARIDPRERSESTREGVAGEVFRDALSQWASTVTVVAVRDEGHVHAVTVTSFIPVSAEPPLVALSLGANASVVPWLEPGARFTVSLLSEGQRRVASDFADPYPVGPSPFPPTGDPIVGGAVASLACTVREVHETEGAARLVLGLVEGVEVGGGDRPLLYHRRGYRGVAPEE